MNMTDITLATAWNLIEGTRPQGTIFNVSFIKRTTGEERTMRARLGVKRGVTGVGMAYNPKSKNLIACYDVQKAQEMKALGLDDVAASKKSYRMIDANTLTKLAFCGQSYTVANA